MYHYESTELRCYIFVYQGILLQMFNCMGYTPIIQTNWPLCRDIRCTVFEADVTPLEEHIIIMIQVT